MGCEHVETFSNIIGRDPKDGSDMKIYLCFTCGVYFGPNDPILQFILPTSVSQAEFSRLGMITRHREHQ